MIVRFVRLNASARPPVFESHCAAGADLCSAENCVVPAKGKFFAHYENYDYI
jgi:hypothetical protein